MAKTNVRVKLVGEDGNAFAIMGRVKRALEKGGRKDLVAPFLKEAQSGDYDNLLWVVQEYVEGFGYSVVRELVGHGIGKQLHEKPDVPNYGRRGSGVKMPVGLTICIEPMINMGAKTVVQDADGWTIRTADRMPCLLYTSDAADE